MFSIAAHGLKTFLRDIFGRFCRHFTPKPLSLDILDDIGAGIDAAGNTVVIFTPLPLSSDLSDEKKLTSADFVALYSAKYGMG